jgi:hypothetical protein
VLRAVLFVLQAVVEAVIQKLLKAFTDTSSFSRATEHVH